MKHFLLSACLLYTAALYAQQPAGLSPRTKIFLAQTESSRYTLPDGYVYRTVGNHSYVSALLQVGTNVDEAAIRNLGVQIGTKAGNIWTSQIPIDKVAALSTVAGVRYIQLDEPVYPNLDAARAVTRVDSVHAGLGTLPSPFHGDNVVVGIIDAGFDYRHPSLFDTTGSRYRVKKIWEQVQTGTPPSGFSYGNEITDSTAMWSKGFDQPISHGAHVAGIAAGSGYGSNNNSQFRGMADAADLVLVGITPPSTDWTSTGMSSIIDALSYIYTYAASVGKPAIANLSWGCSIGSHDGLSLFSQACDNLTGAGKIFSISAGNNGQDNIHIQKSFTATDTLVRSFISFNTSLGAKKTWIDIWGDTAQNFCVQLSLYNGAQPVDSTGFICLDNLVHPLFVVNSNNDTLYAIIATSSAEFNGKPRIFLDIYNKANDQVLVTVKGTSGNVHIWNSFVQQTTGYYSNFVSNGQPWAVSGNTNYTVGDMASTKSALTVGAFISKTSFTNVSGNNISFTFASQNGYLAGFSSKGPTVDGRTKPDIAAPGMALASAVNSYDPSIMSTGANYSMVAKTWPDPQNGRTYSHAMLMGTSMSAPAAAGIVALMLQANPNLTPQQVKQALAQTAIKDNKTGSIPAQGSNSWGFGKINAMGALQQAIALTSIKQTSLQKEVWVFPNPATDVVHLAFSTNRSAPAEVEVFDITGRKVWHSLFKANAGYNQRDLHTAEWSAGVYLLRLRTAEGNALRKIVIE
jgi:minor extracellular serine protease Vpr